MNIFNRYYKKYDDWYDKNKFAYLSELKVLKRVLPKEGKGLEIGVGTGRFAQALGITMGIDCSKKMLDVAVQRGVIVQQNFAEELPFFKNSFDYATIIITLCFVKNPQKVLSEARRVLKEKGRIIIGIVDKNSFLGKFYQKKKSLFYKKANFFSPQEIIKLLKAIGFDQFSCFQTIFQAPDKIKSVEKPEKGFGKGGFVVVKARKGTK